jgi:hypothetical protein
MTLPLIPVYECTNGDHAVATDRVAVSDLTRGDLIAVLGGPSPDDEEKIKCCVVSTESGPANFQIEIYEHQLRARLEPGA